MPIETPCTKVCAVDPLHELCVGCGRNRDEIAGWTTMTDRERFRVMRELPRRLRLIEAAGAAAAGPA